MLAETHRLEDVLRDKGIPAWVDYWGSDASHDWPWWHRQLVYFMELWLDQERARRQGGVGADRVRRRHSSLRTRYASPRLAIIAAGLGILPRKAT